MNNPIYIKTLFSKFVEDECTKFEIGILLDYFGIEDHDEELLRELLYTAMAREELSPENAIEEKFSDHVITNLNDIIASGQKAQTGKFHIWWKIAASILLVLSAGIYIWQHKQHSRQMANVQQHDIAPGRNQATLTLASGKKIILTNNLRGQLATEGNSTVVASPGKALSYIADALHAINTVAYNTLSTGRGEQSPFPLILADGTKVWLNAVSSITFPTAFNGADRTVKITGEVYFEVAHNASKTFRVKLPGQTVEDIGTSFNINSYADEGTVKTTLVQGAVKIIAGTIFKILKPGERSVLSGTKLAVETANVDEETAWKNGVFLFQDEDLHSVMRKLARWYNIEVVYDRAPEHALLGGAISRSRNISEVLSALEETGAVKFKVEDRKVIVTR